MDQPQSDVSRRLLQIQNEALKRENAMLMRANAALSRENAEVREMYNALKESVDEALRISRQRTTKHLLESGNSEATEDTVTSDDATQKQLSEKLAEDGCTS